MIQNQLGIFGEPTKGIICEDSDEVMPQDDSCIAEDTSWCYGVPWL